METKLSLLNVQAGIFFNDFLLEMTRRILKKNILAV